MSFVENVMIRWFILILILFLFGCPAEEIAPVVTTSVVTPKNVSSRYYVTYDLYFKRWGEFYFPFEDHKWFKAQGIAESNLDPKAVSWCGAQGIMQIMPKTGIGLGLKDPWNPEESIQMGIKYDKWVDGIFKAIDQPERRKFMFAGYNAGSGNIQKAKKLANSDIWSDVADQLPLVTGKNNAAETTGYVKNIHKIKEVI
jgi:membrane-bound lytic murein transglycosylase MltF